MSLLNAVLLQCRNTPQAIALSEGEKSLTYGQFQTEFESLAALLLQQNCQNERVALYLDKNLTAITAIYAVLASGGTYLPLDTKNPPDRINFILRDAQPKLILGQGACPPWLEQSNCWLDLDGINYKLKFDYPEIDDSQLAAILYTSGSTGSPKGVALSHRAMRNFAAWAAETFNINEHDRIASLAPLHFDLSVFDLFSSLAHGARVVLMPNTLCLSPAKLVNWLREQRISCWYTVPSILSFISLKGGLAETLLPDLHTLLFAGEVFPSIPLINLCKLLPATQMFNLFGPTETNVCCYWPVDRNRLDANQAIPIGHAACGSELRINPESGELLVRSDNNFSGYWRAGKLEARSQDEWYASGDRVSLNSWGELCYHGRLDRLLKCSGYRVEPAEIEAILCQQEQVLECAVVGIIDSGSGQRPAAALVLHDNNALGKLLPKIHSSLPAYMKPSKIITLTSLPRLANGKIDYLAVQQQFASV